MNSTLIISEVLSLLRILIPVIFALGGLAGLLIFLIHRREVRADELRARDEIIINELG
jgi:hypothetical protein